MRKTLFGGIFAITFIAIIMAFILIACGSMDNTTLGTPSNPNNEEVPKLAFMAEFYENDSSIPWLSVKGSTFDISPNKVKEYSYDSDGSWISQWTMSSVMSISIDGVSIDTCGDTVIFSDTSLQKFEVELPNDIDIGDDGNSSITVPGNIRARDYWTVGWWWANNQTVHRAGNKIVVIKSQTGKPICMYIGNNVTWEVSRNLPKTTLVHIDGKALYIHRANFAIIDTTILEG